MINFGSDRVESVVALEIGTSKTLVGVGVITPDGLSLAAVGETHTAGMRKGDVIDRNKVIESLRCAISNAEKHMDESIDDVSLVVSGYHVNSERQRGNLKISPDGHLPSRVKAEHCDKVRRIAEEHIALSPERRKIMSEPMGYRVDDSERIPDPCEMTGFSLTGEFLVVHGVQSRIISHVDCVSQCGVDVDDAFFAPFASAEAVLNDDQRRRGAMVLDLGGGLTQYAVFKDGFVEKAGVLGVGGDHVTTDISKAFCIPIDVAQMAEHQIGTLLSESVGESEIVDLKSNRSLFGKKIYRRDLSDVMRVRMEETLELVRGEVGEDLLRHLGGGIWLTGGGSMMTGIQEVASRVFHSRAVQRVTNHLGVAGNAEQIANPRYSTMIGVHKRKQQEHSIQRRKSSFRQIFSSAVKKMSIL